MKLLETLKQKGWTPHAGQFEYLFSNARFRVLACGRRWGKTDASAADIAMRMVETPSSKQLAIAPTIVQVRIVFERIKWMLSTAGIAYLATVTPHPTIRIFENDNKKEGILHIVDARSGHEATSLRGEGADHILIDEAAYIPESLITEVAMPMLAANNGRMSLLSTPRGRNHFYRFFAMGQRGDNGFWSRHSPSEENPLVDPEYLAIQKEIISEWAYRTEYCADFVDTIETVFSIDALDAALMAPYANGSVVVGVDWGRYRDYTAVVAVRGTQTRAEVIDCAKWNRLTWHEMVEKVAVFAGKNDAKKVICDGTGGGDKPSDDLHGVLPDIGFKKIVFNRQNKGGFIEPVVRMLEHKQLRLPPEPDLLRELESYQAHADENGVKYEADSGMHDDLVTALVLACSELEVSEYPQVLMKERKPD